MKQRNDKDCLQTCLSELLGIDYEEIPLFYENYDEDTFTQDFDIWLREKGFFRVLIPAAYDNINDNVPMPYISLRNYRCIGILKKEHFQYSHCVILNIEEGVIKIDDPKPKSKYDIRDLEFIELIFKIDDLYAEKGANNAKKAS